MSGELALSVVMPAYNEEGAIAGVVAAWDDALDRLGIPSELRVYDDGSQDGTGRHLDELARSRSRLLVVHQSNRGHGPTVLRGYAEARGDWIFQVDSDDEIAPESLDALWSVREGADLVLGYRVGRRAPWARRLITAVARSTVRCLFGASVRDVNTPCRLYRMAALREVLPAVPVDVFAPNVILTGIALRAGWRVLEVPIPHRSRRVGGSHIVRLRLWRAAVAAFAQTVRVAASVRRSGRG